MIKTLDEFVKFCKTASNDDIYDAFEFDTTDEVRDQVYELASPDANEPFRSAMYNLGFVNY